VLVVRRQTVHTRRAETSVQFAAFAVQKRQKRDELYRGLIVRPGVDQLLEIVERKNVFHRFNTL
jgi:hypothetical protein